MNISRLLRTVIVTYKTKQNIKFPYSSRLKSQLSVLPLALSISATKTSEILR